MTSLRTFLLPALCAVAMSASSGLAAVGCAGHSTCNSFSQVPTVVQVIDAVTGAPICDATVVAFDDDGASDGAPSAGQTLAPVPAIDGGADCTYESPNVGVLYKLQASKTEYSTVTTSVSSETVSCDSPEADPAPQTVTLRLTRS